MHMLQLPQEHRAKAACLCGHMCDEVSFQTSIFTVQRERFLSEVVIYHMGFKNPVACLCTTYSLVAYTRPL